MVSLENLSVTDVTIVNKMDLKDAEVQIGVNHTVTNFPDQNRCMCDTSVTLIPKDSKPEDPKFKVYINLKSNYTYSQDSSLATIHVETFGDIFPHLRSITATAMSSALIPPLYLPNMTQEYSEGVKSGTVKI